MKAEIISIGTELIIGHTVNTNATYISEKLNSIGISVHYHTSVGDNETRIKHCLQEAFSRSDLVILTGGLGPTDDDITHDVVASFLGLSLSADPSQEKILIDKYSTMGGDGKMPRINYKQARTIESADPIENPIGTAIGMFIKYNNSSRALNSAYSAPPRSVYLATFPGVPCEMEAMLASLMPRLSQILKTEYQAQTILSKKIKFANITESRMAQTIIDHYQERGLPNPFNQANPSLAPYASLAEVYLRVTASAPDHQSAQSLIDSFTQEITAIFPNKILGFDDDTVESVLATKLKKHNLKISFAESCTGGLASKLITDLPGASQYTTLNLVTYANSAKIAQLGVNPATLEQFGAVSEECAREMAIGLTKISGADINVSITGIAGPDGATPEKPIGTIFVGIIITGRPGLKIISENHGLVDHSDGFYIYNRKLDWTSRRLSREQVRELACKKIFWQINSLLP